MNSRFSLACAAALALSSLASAPAVCADDPRVVVVFQSSDEVIGDLKYLCGDLAGKPRDWQDIVRPNVEVFLFGIEGARPFRCDHLLGSKAGFRQQVMAPIGNLNDFINNNLVPLGILVQQHPQDKNLYSLVGGGFNGWMRVTAGYAVFADAAHREDLPANMPAPGDSHAGLLKQGYDVAAQLDNRHTTPEERSAAFGAFRDRTLGGTQRRPGESQAAFSLRKVNSEHWLERTSRLFVESSLLTIGLTIDSHENVGTGKVALAALPGTPLADTLMRQAQRPSRFAGVAKPEEPLLAARVNYALDELSTRQLAETCKLMKAALQQQIGRTEGLPGDQREARKQVAGLVLDMLTTSLDLGKLDGLLQITSSEGGGHTGLMAIGAQGSAPVTTILELLAASANGCRTDLNVDTAGDVAIHRLTVSAGYPPALQEFFGDSGEVFIGAGPDAIWLSVGDGAVEALKACVAAAAKAPARDVDPTVASLDLDLLAVLQLMNRLRAESGPAAENRASNASPMFQDDGNYRLRIDLKRIEDRLEGDLQFESGILKSLGEAIVDYAREHLG